MFGTRLIKETRTVVFLDPAFRTDLINFVHNCTMFDLADGTVDPKAFAASVDVWALMGNPNPARFSTITTAGNVDVKPCPGVYANLSGTHARRGRPHARASGVCAERRPRSGQCRCRHRWRDRDGLHQEQARQCRRRGCSTSCARTR